MLYKKGFELLNCTYLHHGDADRQHVSIRDDADARPSGEMYV
jgi:hypothetical protein